MSADALAEPEKEPNCQINGRGFLLVGYLLIESGQFKARNSVKVIHCPKASSRITDVPSSLNDKL